MNLYINTSTPLCRMRLEMDDGTTHDYEWQADRQLAKELLGYIESRLAEHSATFSDIKGIGVYEGPGSFTGLRIGLTVMNTVADGLNIPIVGATGADWILTARGKLESGENDRIVLPDYGSEAHITKPRK